MASITIALTLITLISITVALLDPQKTKKHRSDSCPISRDFAQVVPYCPVTEEGWMKAAERKSCNVCAKHCVEPGRLVYHCVINPFINETLEVCAYAQNIIGGFCAEYSRTGNLIQPNYKAPCGNFTSQPCPNFYRSNEGFKYPGCYELARSPHIHSSKFEMQSTIGCGKQIVKVEVRSIDYLRLGFIFVTSFVIGAACSVIRNLYMIQRRIAFRK